MIHAPVIGEEYTISPDFRRKLKRWVSAVQQIVDENL
jgi:hypothetical protein